MVLFDFSSYSEDFCSKKVVKIVLSNQFRISGFLETWIVLNDAISVVCFFFVVVFFFYILTQVSSNFSFLG